MKTKQKRASGPYVDGFVLSVPTKKMDAYKKMAQAAGKVWMKYGALQYVECMGDDMSPDMGGEKIMTFGELANPKKGETVMFSFIVYKSRKHRDEVNAKVMEDMQKNADKFKDMVMPFETARMAYGGFQSIVNL